MMLFLWRLQSQQLVCRLRCCVRASMHSGVRVRFAPSPTGDLHLGGLRTALYNYLFACANKGKFILRIEDTDQARLIPGASQKIIDMLDWAGITIHEGPYQQQPFGPYIQSERLHLYREHAENLTKNGAAYYCFCSPRRLEILRKEAARRGETPKYDNRCRHMSAAEASEKLEDSTPYVIRFKLEPYAGGWHDLVYGDITTDVASIEGDPVIMKSDGFPTYHFANVVDDHLMQISHVLRGWEWQVSTTKHLLMYEAFGWQPPQYAHLPLLLRKDRQKLSKREKDFQVGVLRDEGYLPDAVLNLLTHTGSGFICPSTSGMTLSQMAQHFSLSAVTTHSTMVDMDQLPPLNQIHLKWHAADPTHAQHMVKTLSDELNVRYKNRLAEDSSLQRAIDVPHVAKVVNWAIAQDRICRLSDLMTDASLQFLWEAPQLESVHQLLQAETSSDTQCVVLQHTIQYLTQSHTGSDGTFTVPLSELRQCHRDLVGQNSIELSFKCFMNVLRISLTGCKSGPRINEVLSLLEKQPSIVRLDRVLKAAKHTHRPQLTLGPL